MGLWPVILTVINLKCILFLTNAPCFVLLFIWFSRLKRTEGFINSNLSICAKTDLCFTTLLQWIWSFEKYTYLKFYVMKQVTLNGVLRFPNMHFLSPKSLFDIKHARATINYTSLLSGMMRMTFCFSSANQRANFWRYVLFIGESRTHVLTCKCLISNIDRLLGVLSFQFPNPKYQKRGIERKRKGIS